MSRNRFFLIGLLVLGWVNSVAKPNVVIILSDDMGYSDIGCYGGEIQTPNLDSLAKDGLRFSQFYNAARCCPTRASLLSGLYQHQAGIGLMTGDKKLPGYQGELGRNILTIAEALGLAGYKNYMSGKWHVTKHTRPEGPKENWPRQRGFDRFYGTITGAGSFYDPATLCRENTYITPVNDSDYQPETYYYTDAISDNAVRFLKDHEKSDAEKPFFLYLAYTTAHWPMHALPRDIKKYQGMYDGGFDPIRKARLKKLKTLGLVSSDTKLSPGSDNWEKTPHKEWEIRNMETYAAMVDNMDQGIGRVIKELRNQDKFKDTLFLYLQDNGGCAEGYGRYAPKNGYREYQPMEPDELQKKIWPPMQTRDGRPLRVGPGEMAGPEDTFIGYGRGWANVSNTPFREYKPFAHEGGIATPLIAHWPKGIAPQLRGKFEHQPAHLIDLMATCVDLGRAEYPKEANGQKIVPMQGVSLKPAFSGKKLGRENPIFWEHEGNRAIRIGKWKLVAKGANGAWELYDLNADRSELNDLSEKHQERTKEMADRWEAWAIEAKAKPWPWNRKKSSFSKKKVFNLKPDANLPMGDAPMVAKKAFEVEVQLEKQGDGILVAQGGDAHGWNLFMNKGFAQFTVRLGGKVEKVKASEKLGSKELRLSAKLDSKGMVNLYSGDRTIGSGTVSGLVKEMPADGLQVGRDEGGMVGGDKESFAFDGKIRKVRIKIN